MLKILASLTVVLMPAVAYADADPYCDSRENLIKLISNQYGEQQMWSGVNESGNLVEIFTDPKDQSWTMFITDTSGKSCVDAEAMTGRGYFEGGTRG